MKYKSLALAIATSCMLLPEISYANTPCYEESSNCINLFADEGISNQELIKVSDDEYVFEYLKNGQPVTTVVKKDGDVVHVKIDTNGSETIEYQNTIDRTYLGPISRSGVVSCTGDSTWSMPNGKFDWDGVKYFNPRTSVYGHPDKDHYYIQTGESKVIRGKENIHIMFSKATSEILTQTPAWALGGMIGAVMSSATAAVVGTFMAGPLGTTAGAAVGGLAGGVVGAVAGAAIAVSSGAILGQDLPDEEGNVWMVMDLYSVQYLDLDESSGLFSTTFRLHGRASFRTASIGKYCAKNLSVDVDKSFTVYHRPQ